MCLYSLVINQRLIISSADTRTSKASRSSRESVCKMESTLKVQVALSCSLLDSLMSHLHMQQDLYSRNTWAVSGLNCNAYSFWCTHSIWMESVPFPVKSLAPTLLFALIRSAYSDPWSHRPFLLVMELIVS